MDSKAQLGVGQADVRRVRSLVPLEKSPLSSWPLRTELKAVHAEILLGPRTRNILKFAQGARGADNAQRCDLSQSVHSSNASSKRWLTASRLCPHPGYLT